MPAEIDQSDWDSKTVEKRKRELETRGYVNRLVIQSEIDEAWGRRFYERLVSGLESPGIRVPKIARKRLQLDVFETISKISSSITKREFDSTGRAHGVIIKTVHWSDVCTDLALLAYESKGEV